MSAEDELKDIKQILSQIRNQGAAGGGSSVPTPNAADLEQYTRQLSLARGELENLEKGTSAYNRKQKEVESLTRKTRNAMKDQRQETDLLTLSTQGLSGAMSMLANAADTIVLKFAGAVKTVFEEAKKLDTVTVEFRRTTGASAALASNIGELTDRMRLFGIDSAAAGAAIGTLHSSFTGFTQLNQAQQLEIGRTAALLGELGISYSTTAQIFESSTRTLGLSLGETESLLIDLRSTAMALQVPIEQLTRDFTGAENMVAAMGVSGPKAFKDLAAASKATGVEMNTLLGITEKFDTFEGAAEAVQGLNAVLGGNYLDSLSMVEETDPTKRFEMIRDAVFAAGHSVESLANSNDYYLKKSLAGVMGTDVSTFMKMLSGDVDELTGQVDTAAVSFEDLSKEAFGLRGFDSVMNNLTGALARPVTRIQEATRATFEGFTPLIDRFESFNEGLIEKTNSFIAKNSEMVGAVGILYNLGNIDGVQKGYEIFKGIAGFSGSVLSNLFSVKGLLAVMAGGVLFAIKDDFKEIGQAFTDDGFMGGLTAIWNVLTEKFGQLQDYLDEEFGINKNFLTKGLNVLKALAIEGYQYFNVYLLQPVLGYLKDDVFPFLSLQIRKLLNNVLRSFSTMVGPLGRKLLFGTGSQGEVNEKLGAEKKSIAAEEEKRAINLSPEAKLEAATLARQAAMGEFMGTRGAQTIEAEATKVVEKVAPHVAKAYEVVEDVAKSAKDAGFEFGKEMVQVFKEGVAEAGAAHIDLQVNIDGRALDASVARATSSKLNSIGSGTIVNGSGS
jgi:hypothetical protein